MAPLPPNNTDRIYLDYTSNNVGHTLILRPYAFTGENSDYADAWATVFSQVKLATDSFYGARFQAAGTNFSLPIEFAEVPGTLGGETTLWSQDPESAQMSFVFRGLDTGRRGRIELFTPVALTPWPTDNRYNPGDQSTVDALRADVQELGVSTGDFPLASIGGDPVNIYSYANIRLNGYWQTRQRVS
jgi:hypothetical protein